MSVKHGIKQKRFFKLGLGLGLRLVKFKEEEAKIVHLYVPVMQESPRVGVRWSIISLNGLSYKDAGEYRCQARNMAGISEAPIKLKVVGVSQLSRLPKRKLQKTPKPSLKYRKSNQTRTTITTPSVKENQILQNITSPSINKTQTSPNLESQVFPVHKRRKTNSTNAKKKTRTSIKFASESWQNSTTSLLSETLMYETHWSWSGPLTFFFNRGMGTQIKPHCLWISSFSVQIFFLSHSAL